jgi:uncharacterized protein YjiS (DUF1127 family)
MSNVLIYSSPCQGRPILRNPETSSSTPTVLLDTARIWMARRRQRKALRELVEHDDRMLRDVGLSRDEVRREAAKPFWR